MDPCGCYRGVVGVAFFRLLDTFSIVNMINSGAAAPYVYTHNLLLLLTSSYIAYITTTTTIATVVRDCSEVLYTFMLLLVS